MSHQLKIEKIAYGGEGIGFLNGKVCFVPGVLPGETVEIELVQDKKKFSRGKLIKVLEPASFRIPAPCVYVETCGGCQYQHMEYAEELKWKEIQVREYLSRNLKIAEDLIHPIIGCSNSYHYRNSLTVHRTETGQTGFFSEDNENITPVETCLLADKRLEPVFKTEWTGNQEKKTSRLSAEGELVSDEQDKIFPVKVGEHLIYTTGKSFFQNNLEMTAKIGQVLKAWVRKIKPVTFVDLYAGVGTFSVLGASNIRKTVCIEDNPYSQPALKLNLETLGVPHEILNERVEKVFPHYFSQHPLEKPVVFADPPRMGMAPRASAFLAQCPVEGIAYLSCHLGTLTRDLEIILNGGCFAVEEVIPFDMFPRTKHIEILVFLKRI